MRTEQSAVGFFRVALDSERGVGARFHQEVRIVME